MFKVEELQEMKKVEVQNIAKDLGIPRFTTTKARTKEELISDILAKQNNGDDEVEETKEEPVTETPEVHDEDDSQVECSPKESKVVSEVKKLKEKKNLSDEERAAKKQKYIDDAKVGTLVAFKTDTGKVKSAMIMKRSTTKRKFLVETQYGQQYKISFDDVIWVRTNKRWPKPVYLLLKGNQIETESKGE